MNAIDPSRNAIAARAFRWWLVAGAVLTLVFPALRGFDPALGWWPMWLVMLPLCCLLMVRPRAAAELMGAIAPQGLRRNAGALRRQAVRYRVSR